MAETAKRKNPEIWERAKAKAKRKMGGKWSGRAAQLAVNYYKQMGGKYEGKKKETSLSRWTDQDWDYVGEKGQGRYLPKGARDSLTSGQKAAGSRAKNKATKGGKGKASYTEAERKAVRRATKK
jgi:hypothetical protein